MDYQQILKSIKQGDVKPFYFLSGTEPYFIDLITNYIEATVLDESEKAFNQTIVYGKDVKWDELVESLKRYPMMAEKQLIILKEAQSIPKLTDKLIPYLNEIVSSTVFVVCYKYKTTTAKKFIQLAQSKGIFFESKELYENKIPDWISGYLARKKFNITPKASMLLTEYLGNNLSKIANELEKLTIALDAGTEINAEHIEENIGISKDFNIFELQDAIVQRDVLKANRIVNYFSDNSKNHPFVVTVGSLYSFYARLMAFHYLKDKSPDNIMQKLKVRFYPAQQIAIAGKKVGPKKCFQALRMLREYDRKSKGIDNVSTTDGELLKELAFKLLH